MTYFVSKKIMTLYRSSKRNHDLALHTILNSFDPDTYETAFEIAGIEMNPCESEKIEIGEESYRLLTESFPKNRIDNMLINQLLWIAVLFPEI